MPWGTDGCCFDLRQNILVSSDLRSVDKEVDQPHDQVWSNIPAEQLVLLANVAVSC